MGTPIKPAYGGAAAAAGGGGAASFTGVVPDVDFYMGGELGAAGSVKTDATMTIDVCYLDFVHFAAATTTISHLGAACNSASGGGALTVSLHEVTGRLSIGPQLFTADLTIGTGAATFHESAIGTPWEVPKGHYMLVMYGAAAITNIISAFANNATGEGYSTYFTGRAAFVPGLFEVETKTMAVQLADYIGTPTGLSDIDFNDFSLYQSGLAEAKITPVTTVPIVLMKVSATT